MTDFPDVKIKALVSFPASVIAGLGIDITTQDGSFIFDLDYRDFMPPLGGFIDAVNQNALVWNQVTGGFALAPIALFGGAGGGVPEAPVGTGDAYARKDAAWIAIVTSGSGIPEAPNNGLVHGRKNVAGTGSWQTVLPTAGGTMSGQIDLPVSPPPSANQAIPKSYVDAAVALKAPINNPDLAGTPQTAAPAAGDNSRQIATTAFVKALIPAGTVMLFFQAAAPVGWTKLTTQNDKALRVVSGSGGVAGGTNAFSTVMAQSVVGGTAISIAQMPAHTHPETGVTNVNSTNFGSDQSIVGAVGGTTGSTGGGATHNHSITMAIQYIDIILASKD